MSSDFVLGLDLGPSSVGWAVVEETAKQVIAAGVRIFPEGVDRDKQGGEQPKNKQCRIARGMRRQTARRARRKRLLRQCLVRAGLLPAVAALEPSDPARVAWESAQYQTADPYQLRRRALIERLDPHEIGRAFLHLAQRRGFLSNRKSDRSRKKETSDMLQEISALAERMGDQTLGAYLAQLRAISPTERVRGWHTRRSMYEIEFEAIWQAQRRFHPDLLTDALKYGAAGRQEYPQPPRPLGKKDRLAAFGIHGLLFFQRPMYWRRGIVGRCELEPPHRRCPRADRLAQRFRLLQEVNNLRLLDPATGTERSLISEERTALIAYLAKSKERTFADVRKHLGMLETVKFNLEQGGRKGLYGLPTDYALRRIFGKTWDGRPESQKDQIVQCLLDEEEEETLRRAAGEWGLNEEATAKLLAVSLPEGHASYSREAIAKLLPHLELGLPLMAPLGEPCCLRAANYLQPHERTVRPRDFLPPPPDLANPLVRQALHEVRKVVNAILRKYGKPARIHIELAREVKGGAEARLRTTLAMRDREQERQQAAGVIVAELHLKPTRATIDRYLLWREQQRECVYSGKPISLTQLFAGEVDEDHILPRARSLDNSLMNRVVCFRAENNQKKDRTPFEWLADSDPDKYDRVLQAANRLPYPKACRFRQPSVTLDDFFARQFVDTAYLTTQVVDYVRCLGVDIVPSKGRHTAELRHHWGLNSVLRDDALELKNREDHRHHAVDAIVIALTSRSRLHQLAALFKQGGTARTGEVLPEPWPDFRNQVERLINGINVSHKVQRKVKGALHEETLYGPTSKPPADPSGERPWAKNWIEDPNQFVSRKPLEMLTLAEVERIRDERVKEVVIARLQQFGIKPGRKPRGGEEDAAAGAAGRAIPKEVWKEPLYLPPRKGRPSERPARIKKVRVLKKDRSIRPIRQGRAWIKPGSLHHLCLFEYRDERGKTRCEAVFVSMLEAATRLREKRPLIQRVHPHRPDARFIMSLSRGEMVLGTFKGQQRLVWFNTASSGKSRQLFFISHTDARPRTPEQQFSAQANTLQGRKVTVNPLGEIRWAND